MLHLGSYLSNFTLILSQFYIPIGKFIQSGNFRHKYTGGRLARKVTSFGKVNDENIFGAKNALRFEYKQRDEEVN